jgi:hypothetical protein
MAPGTAVHHPTPTEEDNLALAQAEYELGAAKLLGAGSVVPMRASGSSVPRAAGPTARRRWLPARRSDAEAVVRALLRLA